MYEKTGDVIRMVTEKNSEAYEGAKERSKSVKEIAAADKGKRPMKYGRDKAT